MSSSAPQPAGYMFNRNGKAGVRRLNYQHFLITQLTGNRILHKSTEDFLDSQKPHHVADIGTGTATWPLSLAQSQPNWQIDGFDISGDQYPFPDWLPANVSLHIHDTFLPYPEKYHGKYDLVNVRFMVTLLSEEKLHLLLRHIKALLKPEGILQWLEPITCDVRAIGPRGVSTACISQVAAMFQSSLPDSAKWMTLNCDMVKSDGYEPVAWERLHFEDIHRPIWNQCSMMGLEEIVDRFAESTIEAELVMRENMQNLMKGCEQEYEQGASLETPWFFLAAQKPV